MRILHLDAGREMRGGQWQVLRLVEGLAAAGVESTLLAVRDAPLYTAARQRGMHVEPLSLLRALLALGGHDLLHAHDARSHTIGALTTCISLGIPGGVPLVVSRRVGFGIRSRWKYRRPARFIAVSEYVKSVLVQGGVATDKIGVVYDGVPLLQIATGTPGGFKPTGIIHNAITVLAKGSALVSAAKTAAQLAGITLQPTVNLEHDLRHTAALLYLSDSEGLGSGALLAMSAGVPVVASKVGGLLEVIEDGENGILVPNEATAIATALLRLLDNPDLIGRLGLAARQTVMDRFTVDRMVRHTMEVYRQVLS